MYGIDTDESASMDLALAGTPVSVAFAAAPLAGDEDCEAEVTLIRTDGAAVNVATQSVSEAVAFELGADIEGGGLASLFQEEAGTVTLEVASDCSYAASIIAPAE
jgi:hypothetical protein